jgi:hypothetical protein
MINTGSDYKTRLFVDQHYRPFKCPFDCENMYTYDMVEHLICVHKTTAIKCPYFIPLKWTTEVCDGAILDANTDLGRRWKIILQCENTKDTKFASFLLIMDQYLKENTSELGDFCVQLISLNYECEFLVAAKLNVPGYSGSWVWRSPTLHEKPSKVLLPKDITKNLDITSNNSKIVPLIIAIKKLHKLHKIQNINCN